MNSVRRVLAVTIVVTGLLTGALPFLSQQQATGLTQTILVFAFAVDFVACLVLIRMIVFDHDRPRSWLLVLNLITAIFTALGLGFVIFPLLLPPGTLPSGVGRLLIGIGVVLVAAPPAMKAAVFSLVDDDPTAVPRS